MSSAERCGGMSQGLPGDGERWGEVAAAAQRAPAGTTRVAGAGAGYQARKESIYFLTDGNLMTSPLESLLLVRPGSKTVI